MGSRFLSLLSRPALLRGVLSHVRLAARLVREPFVPTAIKALLVLPALYLVSPVDLLPDVIPGLGQLDDLALLFFALEAFVRLCPSAAVHFHRAALNQGRTFTPMAPGDVVIDAEFKRG